MEVVEIAAVAIMALSWAIAVPSGLAFIFFYKHNVYPCRARSAVLITLVWVLFAGDAVHFYFLLLGYPGNCVFRYWFAYIWNGLTLVYLVRVLRLLWIFNLTKYRLEAPTQENPVKMGVLEKLWSNSAVLKELNLFLMFFAIYMFFFLFPLIATIQHSLGDIPKDCISNTIETGNFIEMAFVLCGLIFIGVKLRKVHDGYYLKKEMLLCVWLSAEGNVWFWLAFVYPPAARWCYTLLMSIIARVFIVSFTIPCILSYRNFMKSKQENSSKSFSSPEIPSAAAAEELDQGKFAAETFTNHSSIANLLLHPLATKYIDKYLLHYQDIRMSDYWNFWNQLIEFKGIKQPELLAGKAYLLFRKFLAPNAYRFIDCIDKETQSKMEEMLNDAMESKAEIHATFFDVVLIEAENVLAKKLFSHFFQSEIFEEFKEATRLEKGLRQVIVH